MICRIAVVVVFLSALAFSQDASKSQGYVTSQFGPEFELINEYPTLTGDLDGDGAEDAVFVATNKENPLLAEADFRYKVVDPYDEFFGWGDPKVTSGFNAHDPDKVKYILIVHDWKATTPKAKFVVLNLPFEKLTIGRIPLKKKVVMALKAEDMTGTTSAIYWDGKKKYKWNSMTGFD